MPTIGNGRYGPHRLNGAHLKTVLTDRSVICISNSPRVSREIERFPCWVWNCSSFVIKKSGANTRTKTKHPDIFFNICDSEPLLIFIPAAHFIEIHVRRHREGSLHVHKTVCSPVHENRCLIWKICIREGDRAGA